MADKQSVWLGRLAIFNKMFVNSPLADKIHMPVTEHPAQITVGIIHNIISVAGQPVGNFNRHSVDKTAFEAQQVKVGNMNDLSHDSGTPSFATYNKF